MRGEQKRPRLDHALAIGATGMLAAVRAEIAIGARVLTSIARTQRSLDSLHTRLSSRDCIHQRIALDYNDDVARTTAIERSMKQHGPVDFVLAWIHEDEPRIAVSVARCTAGPARFLHVLGSATRSPGGSADSIRKCFLDLPAIGYAQVILGFRIVDGHSRWLTAREITAAGVTRALDVSREQLVVGSVTPWSSRP